MKFKVKYLYIAAVVIIAVFLILTANKNNDQTFPGSLPPDDNIHRGLNEAASTPPSKENVSKEFMHQLEQLKKAVEDNPGDTLRLREYADFLAAAHKPADAIPYYNKILEIDPQRIDILFSLSFIHYNQKNFDETEKLTRQILAADKDNLQAAYNLGALAAGRGEKQEAKNIWEKIIKDHPGSEVAELAKSSLQKL